MKKPKRHKASRIRWKKRKDKVGNVYHMAEVDGYESMLINEDKSRRLPYCVEYLSMTTFLESTRSFATWDKAEAFARKQARLSILGFLQGAHDALEALT